MHDHAECKHVYGYGHSQDGQSSLKHCQHCDVVYCELCKCEWGEQKLYVPQPYPVYVPYAVPYRIVPWWSTTITNGSSDPYVGTYTVNSAGNTTLCLHE